MPTDPHPAPLKLWNIPRTNNVETRQKGQIHYVSSKPKSHIKHCVSPMCVYLKHLSSAFPQEHSGNRRTTLPCNILGWVPWAQWRHDRPSDNNQQCGGGLSWCLQCPVSLKIQPTEPRQTRASMTPASRRLFHTQGSCLCPAPERAT